LLTIRVRLGRGEVGSFSPRLLGFFFPLSGRKRLSLNYGRGTRLNFAERTKGRFKLNARLFRLRQSSSLYCATLPPPSAAFSSSSLSLGVFRCNPYPSFRLFRSAVAFRSGCFSPGPFSTTSPTRQPPSCLSYVVCTRVTTEERERKRNREKEERESHVQVPSLPSSTFISGVANPRHPSRCRLRNSYARELSAANPHELQKELPFRSCDDYGSSKGKYQ